ncbi:MAG: hypothetical protein H0V45_00830 [Actinobacteria bacterium]|nr:hypothetical protein [Actinomycetota bacterium]
MRAILSDQARDPTLTRSELEERFLSVCARASAALGMTATFVPSAGLRFAHADVG